IQAVLHNVADADDAMQPSTLDDGEMADPLARHLCHHPRDRVIGLTGHGAAHHNIGGAQLEGPGAVNAERFDDVALAAECEEVDTVLAYDDGADSLRG